MVAPHPTPVAQPSALPRALTPILGRECAIADVVALLAEDETRVGTLRGPGGVGKTRLAHELARELERGHGAAVRLVSLAHVTGADDLLAEIAHTLGVHEQGGASLEQVVIQALGQESV